MRRSPTRRPGPSVVRVVTALVGGLLLLAGVALLVLPGPGMLLVLAGVLVLAKQFPIADRYLGLVRRYAADAAEQSVATRARIMLSVLTGVVSIVAGIVWWVVPSLPFGGAATGAGLILSGVLLLVLLAYSYRRRGRPRPSRVR
ncbi:PGPGW domain-containing protein [Pseudonocardia parietis]|uniref:Transmembrane protein PGPGW n=1 Tax=Pseudonocardia parietis TaxID=570936 RepID=A0ABS4VT04_9PSEU|nr:PGPGW domain-containing protein [Pseudonocardia parietis]MBP2367055.1 hypothetical protein [Pseudonocardia parietis]